MQVTLPVCYVCKQQVQRLTSWVDPITGAHELVAECHGQHEVVTLSRRELERALEIAPVHLGVAFLPELGRLALEAPPAVGVINASGDGRSA